MQRSPFIAGTFLVVGIVLLLVSLFWSWIVPTQWIWTEESSREYSEAVQALHALPDYYELHGEGDTHAGHAHAGDSFLGHAASAHAGTHKPSSDKASSDKINSEAGAAPGPSHVVQQRQAVVDRYQAAQQRLIRARQVRQSGSLVVRGAGVAATIIGIAWLLVIRQREGS